MWKRTVCNLSRDWQSKPFERLSVHEWSLYQIVKAFHNCYIGERQKFDTCWNHHCNTWWSLRWLHQNKALCSWKPRESVNISIVNFVQVAQIYMKMGLSKNNNSGFCVNVVSSQSYRWFIVDEWRKARYLSRVQKLNVVEYHLSRYNSCCENAILTYRMVFCTGYWLSDMPTVSGIFLFSFSIDNFPCSIYDEFMTSFHVLLL